MVNVRNKVIFAATFLSKLAFGIFFSVACFFIQSDIVNHGLEDAIKICGGEDWYEDGKRYLDEESSDGVYLAWGYLAWDEKVVHCLHNVRGGLFTAGAVISSVLIFGAAISEMDIMKRMKSTTSKIFKTDDFEALFIIDYPKFSSTMWIVGFVFLLLGQLYNLFQHRRGGVLVLSTYTVAGIGSILLLIAGILRSDFGNRVYLESQQENVSGDIVDQLFHLDTKFIHDVCAMILSGSVFFIIHAIMFFLFLYDEAVSVTQDQDLNNEDIMEEGQNPNMPIDTDKKDSEDEVQAS
ncbi:predicted protein [Chaetoceros tenuissimus]|uniref:Uncharacterized protein n=1 Tax=Chaetoceros tenuissimus TaxID=426638 RepID=A0AAD3CX96_9STRA|nr:predicted protein [Chaetoceros tenuissimus]